jgi:trimeric autotransporter adhesin
LLAGVGAGAINGGIANSFFGARAGFNNTTGSANSFFGVNAGYFNSSGDANTFFGLGAGFSNKTGEGNSFFGMEAGYFNTTGSANLFFGGRAGYFNKTGNSNSFFGNSAGYENVTGSNNTIIGTFANVGAGNLTFATAIGAGAVVNSSNTIALGRGDGSDKVVIYGLGTAGSTELCRNDSNEISTCSSSLRYKTGVQNFTGGLSIVRRLRPIAFNWINGNSADVGFAAEEVNKIEPLLTTTNSSGEIEGVKYGQMTTVLVNAVKEQQAQIESQQEQIQEQQKQIEQQQQQIDALKKIVCAANPGANICKEKQK